MKIFQIFMNNAGELYPYLNAVIPGAIYNREGKTLTIRKEGRLITLRPREIAGGMIAGERDARELLSRTLRDAGYPVPAAFSD